MHVFVKAAVLIMTKVTGKDWIEQADMTVSASKMKVVLGLGCHCSKL